MVQYYRDLFLKHSEMLAPLMEWTEGGPTKNDPIEWTPSCTNKFQQMKALIAKDTILTCPYLSKKYHDPHRCIGRATGRSNHARR